MNYIFALAGNPNSGKTTLFNELTGTSQYVGNWPGVTVEKKEGSLKGHPGIQVTDLPGIYSLSPYTLEEVIARDYLVDEDVDVVINLVDASNLERNLYLTTQLLDMGIPVVIALNMMDRVEKLGDKINPAKLGKTLGCPVVPIVAVKGQGIDDLIAAALKAAEAKPNTIPIRFPEPVETVMTGIDSELPRDIDDNLRRWFTVKLFERDTKATEKLELSERTLQYIDGMISDIEQAEDDDSESLLTMSRYEAIHEILADGYERSQRGRDTLSDKIDRVVTNRFLGLPIFVIIMFAVYWFSTFGEGIGTVVTDWTNDVFVGEWIQGNAAVLLENIGAGEWISGLVVDGILAGVGAVIGFLPQMAMLFFFLSLLEQVGYMARVAFLMDRIFRKFGLSGKSFIPILISSGCAVPGIMATRTIENDKDRRMTIMLTSFIPCGAKLPVIALIAGAVFGQAWWFAPLIYFACILVIIVSGIILKKTKWFEGEPAPFVMELPPYHLPSAKSLFLQIWERLKSFIVKAGTIIFLSSIVIWMLSNLAWNLSVTDPENSILASIGRVLEPIFAPLGFGKWQAIVGTVSGLVAKENLLASMAILFPDIAQNAAAMDEIIDNTQPLWPHIQQLFTAPAAFAFLMFNMICAPCFAAIGSIRREMASAKWTWFTILFQTGAAYVIALMIYQIGTFFAGGGFTVGTAAALAFAALILYLLFRPDPNKRKVNA